MRSAGFLFFALGLVGAGCLGPDPHPSPTSAAPTFAPGRAANETFDGAELPAGWVEHGGTWTSAEGGGQRARVLEGRGDAEPGLSSFVNHAAGSFANFTLEVEFEMLTGDHPQGAGVVFDWRDERNYQIIRYSLSEQGWHLFTVVDGNRDKQPDATLENGTAPEFGEWVALRVTQGIGVVRAWHGDVRVVEYDLAPGNSASGLVGLFTRGDTVARFDDFAVRPH